VQLTHRWQRGKRQLSKPRPNTAHGELPQTRHHLCSQVHPFMVAICVVTPTITGAANAVAIADAATVQPRHFWGQSLL